MIQQEPIKQFEVLASTNGHSRIYGGLLKLKRPEDIVNGSVRLFIGAEGANSPRFVGQPASDGRLRWEAVSSEDEHHANTLGGTLIATTYSVVCHGLPLSAGNEITITYEWQPHYLNGAEVLVRLHNEERFVPIADLKEALRRHLE